MCKITPMMQQYKEIKDKYKDAILFFRMGDFYEMFFDDAITASRELEIALTSRDAKNEIPMAGVPHHSAESYISRLINRGYKVAICEQVEDPKEAKGIVKREVIRVITPGTITDNNALEEKKNNFLISVLLEENPREIEAGLAFVDISTGEFGVTQFTSDKEYTRIIEEISRIDPVECITSSDLLQNKKFINLVKKKFNYLSVDSFDDSAFIYKNAYSKLITHFKVNNLEKFGCESLPLAVQAAGAILEYLYQTQKTALKNINNLKTLIPQEFMNLDMATRRNLELVKSIRDGSKSGTLLWILDKTLTAMGGRMLRAWIEQPLLQKNKIEERLDAVENLLNNVIMREELREQLKEIYDLERLMGRITYGSANARDLIALKKSLKVLPNIRKSLTSCQSTKLLQLKNNLDVLEDICALIDLSIENDPPITVKDGGIIKPGYNEEVDELKKITREGKNLIASLEEEEKEKTGIKSLKIGFNKVFGYYIEVTKSNLSLVPDRYIRKQTLVNGERYITPELKEFETKILGAEERVKELEYNLFVDIREQISSQMKRIQECAKIIAELDVLSSFAEVASLYNYIKPLITNSDEIKIKNSRHPVIERVLKEELFVPNDVNLDCNRNQLVIITGPNMAGKSTYMRQVALIVLMAQIGCFVPADHAEISIVDRIFTRVGASDDLASGDSTFMVEMKEVSYIFKNATKRSLLILDEVGRGTSTYDGLSIAWAVIEYIHKHIGAKTLFATHYHELTQLEGKLDRVKNYKISVKEKGNDIIFLRKIVQGGADKSYGIHVASLAGLPYRVIKRAKEILGNLEKVEAAATNKIIEPDDNNKLKDSAATSFDNKQMGLYNYVCESIIEDIKSLDIMTMTPIEALNYLYSVKKKLQSFEG